ncbi:MAG: apolipoprotein N-acyltransferase [Pseudomonadota bacterium]
MIGRYLPPMVGGLLLALSFPDYGFDVLVWAAFVPLLHSIHRAESPLKAAAVGGAFGFIFFLLNVGWIYRTVVTHGHFSQAPAVLLLVLMVCTLAVVPALFGLFTKLLAVYGWSIAFTAPIAWTALEYMRAVTFEGFPWDLTGYAVAERVLLIQMADITGVYGLSFVILLVNGAIWCALERPASCGAPTWRPLVAACSAVAAVLCYGLLRMPTFPEVGNPVGAVTVGVLQGNVPQDIKWQSSAREPTFAVYEQLAGEAVRAGAKLLIQPETSIPVTFGARYDSWERAWAISEMIGVPMLVGAASIRRNGGRDRFFNSALLLEGRELRAVYDKIHLVPFGEYMPLSGLLPLGPGIAARDVDFTPGETMTVMALPGVPPFSVLICYEAIFPELSRKALRNGARMLVNITNDGWFGDSAAPYQHLGMSRLRAVENRVWLIRCANTGISAVYDSAGREVRSLGLNKRGYFTVDVPQAANYGSIYSEIGDVFAWVCVLATVCIAAEAYHRGERFIG